MFAGAFLNDDSEIMLIVFRLFDFGQRRNRRNQGNNGASSIIATNRFFGRVNCMGQLMNIGYIYSQDDPKK